MRMFLILIVVFLTAVALGGCGVKYTVEAGVYYPDSVGSKKIGDPRKYDAQGGGGTSTLTHAPKGFVGLGGAK